MQVLRLTSFDELAAAGVDWDRLAGDIPFRRRDWLEPWWGAYSQSGLSELCCLCVRDAAGRCLGLAPWHFHRSPLKGNVLRFLGSGEVASEHLSIFALPEAADAVAQEIADWLAAHAAGQPPAGDTAFRWDHLELESVDAADAVMHRFAERLRQRGCLVHRRPGACCWRLRLSPAWDGYLARLSKSHRKQVRRLQRDLLDNGRAALRTVESEAEFDRGWEILVDLHQRRRRSLGDPGCFCSPRFTAFQREAARRLLGGGRLRLHWLELDGRPVAAEYHLRGGDVVYAYQSGVDPEALDNEPGRLAAIAFIRLAVDEGITAIDFLRGDEPYKAHWRAEPCSTVDLLAAPNRLAPRIRHKLVTDYENARLWLRNYWRPKQGRAPWQPMPAE